MSTPNHPDRIIQLIRERFSLASPANVKRAEPGACCVLGALGKLRHGDFSRFPSYSAARELLAALGFDDDCEYVASQIANTNDSGAIDTALAMLREALSKCHQDKLAAIK